jgi:hypothetical protein
MQNPPLGPDVADAAPTSITLTVANSISSRTNAKACAISEHRFLRGVPICPHRYFVTTSALTRRRGFLRQLYQPDNRHPLPFSPVDWHDSAGRAIAVSRNVARIL